MIILLPIRRKSFLPGSPEKGLGFGKVMNPFRVAIIGAAKGPHMFDVIEIIGKEETIRRMEKALSTL